jgi:hypothetical protein
MPELTPFTSNVTDCSTTDGYQFEFHCERCGNGFRSQFRHSVMGFGGRLAMLGGTLIGGSVGGRIEDIGWMAKWNHDGNRGSANDQRLAEASADVAGEFRQCRWCTDWVCRHGCWDTHADCCRTCAPEQQERGAAQHRGPVRYCGSCGAEGSGRFCGSCGTSYDAPPCGGCGAPQTGSRFCQNCGTPAG